MARTRKHDESQAQRLFVVPSEEELTKPKPNGGHVPPQNRRDQQIMASEDKRNRMAYILRNTSATFAVEPVRSNAELAERIPAYFNFCSERRMLPTVEGLSLFVGYSRQTLFDWRKGVNKGFHDDWHGMTTSDIIKRGLEVMASLDGSLAMEGLVSPVPYIYRSANFFNMQQKQTLAVEQENTGMRPPLTPEEIAKNLPDMVEISDIARNLPDNTDFDDMEGA